MREWSVLSFQLSVTPAETAMQNFRDLKVWRKAHALALSIYKATETFPAGERFGLTTQMRRAAASVPSNIAEGCGRSGKRDMARFLDVAFGSASEIEYLLLLAADLGLLPTAIYDALLAETEDVKRMLTALIARVRTDY